MLFARTGVRPASSAGQASLKRAQCSFLAPVSGRGGSGCGFSQASSLLTLAGPIGGSGCGLSQVFSDRRGFFDRLVLFAYFTATTSATLTDCCTHSRAVAPA